MRKKSLVTGATGGIGPAIAEILARAGYDVALCGLREPEAAASLLATLRAIGAEAAYFQTDLTRRDARFSLLQGVQQRFGRLDLLVNNVNLAAAESRDVLEMSEDAFDLVLHTNLQGPFFLTQAVARWMLEQRDANPAFAGAIVFVTSATAGAASASGAEDCIAKAGASLAAAIYAARLAGQGIIVEEVRAGEGPDAAAQVAREILRRISASGAMPRQKT